MITAIASTTAILITRLRSSRMCSISGIRPSGLAARWVRSTQPAPARRLAQTLRRRHLSRRA